MVKSLVPAEQWSANSGQWSVNSGQKMQKKQTSWYWVFTDHGPLFTDHYSAGIHEATPLSSRKLFKNTMCCLGHFSSFANPTRVSISSRTLQLFVFQTLQIGCHIFHRLRSSIRMDDRYFGTFKEYIGMYNRQQHRVDVEFGWNQRKNRRTFGSFEIVGLR